MASKTDPEELAEEIRGYGVLVMTAGIMIFVTYEIMASLVGQLPAQVGTGLLALVVVYIVVVNRKLRAALLAWLQKD